MYISRALITAIYNLQGDGFYATRIEILKDYAVRLRYEVEIPPDPDWDPQPGEWIGKFYGVDMYLSDGTDYFTVMGARK